MTQKRTTMPPLVAAGPARPAKPTSVFAEDFSLLIRIRRLVFSGGRIHVRH